MKLVQENLFMWKIDTHVPIWPAGVAALTLPLRFINEAAVDWTLIQMQGRHESVRVTALEWHPFREGAIPWHILLDRTMRMTPMGSRFPTDHE